jgi:ribosomal protein S4
MARGDQLADARARPLAPGRQAIDTPVQEQLIVELYSK